jgi:drug/metabolite transporter (DMT)-like permease
MPVAKQRGFLDILLMAALFAPSFLFIKIAVQDISPVTLIALRVGIGGLLLLLILKLRKIKIPAQWKLWKYCFTLGIFLNGVPFVLFSYSLTLIPTSLSALLNGMTPIMTVFLANIFLNDEKLNFNRILGVILGLLGFLVLFLPGILNSQMEFNIKGIMLSFTGACLYAVGAVYARKYRQPAPPLVAPTLQLLTSLIYLIPVALIFETPSQLLETPLTSWAAVAGVSVFSTAFAFIMYHKIVSQQGATYVVMATYLLPVFGTILGVVFLNETLTLSFIVTACFIMCGLAVLNGMVTFPFRMLRIAK